MTPPPSRVSPPWLVLEIMCPVLQDLCAGGQTPDHIQDISR